MENVLKRITMCSRVIIIAILFISPISSSHCFQRSPVTIDLHKLIQTPQVVSLSKFVTSLEYIPLEITPECLVSQNPEVYVTRDYIFVRNYGKGEISPLLLFDRKTGKFIRPLGRIGRGPEEYLRLLDCFYNPYDKNIYANAGNTIKTYNISGEFIEAFPVLKVTDPKGKDGYANASIAAFMKGGKYICYINNYNGTISKRIAIITKDIEIKSYPHYEKWNSNDPSKNYVPINQSPLFFSWDDQVSFKEKSNDTIFYVSMEKLIPRLVLYSGNSRYPYKITNEEAIEMLTKPKNYFQAIKIFENSRFLFFDFVTGLKPIKDNPAAFEMIRSFGIYDKQKENAIACIIDKESNSCLSDDINNFMPILPASISENNEMIAVLEASVIKTWKTKNSKRLIELKSGFPWLDKIDELDNPVIVIGKCKD